MQVRRRMIGLTIPGHADGQTPVVAAVATGVAVAGVQHAVLGRATRVALVLLQTSPEELLHTEQKHKCYQCCCCSSSSHFVSSLTCARVHVRLCLCLCAGVCLCLFV